MATIYAATTDGGIRSYGPDDEVWNGVHDNNGSSHVFAVPTTTDSIIYGPTVTFDGTNYNIYRTFFAFDVSGISSTPGSATFKFRANTYSNGDIIAVKATKPSTSVNIANADFKELAGYDESGFDNTDLTAYSAKISGAGTGTAWHTITLNAAARSDMASLGTLAICLMNYDHDYLDSAPGSSLGVNQQFGMYFADSTGTSSDPYIEYTAGFSHSIDGVTSDNIASVIGVATANIANRSGVDT